MCWKRQLFKKKQLFSLLCANRLPLNAEKSKFIIIKPPGAKLELNGLNILINRISLEIIGTGIKVES